MQNRSLLIQVADSTNLLKAFRNCSKGKKRSHQYQQMRLRLIDELVEISGLLRSNRWQWGAYRSFYVSDPKRRLIQAAAFVDRVVHHALCQIMSPWVDPHIPKNSWACRSGMGSRFAAAELARVLQQFGSYRYVVKLDVRSYFASIDHAVLMRLLGEVLPDLSLHDILMSLLASHRDYHRLSCGIPLGNLSSQLFANLYLAGVDRMFAEHTGEEIFYIRYMDDMVIVGRDKPYVLDLKDRVVSYCKEQLHLEIPFQKRTHLANDAVPFLGYLLTETSYKVLGLKLKRLEWEFIGISKKLSYCQVSYKKVSKYRLDEERQKARSSGKNRSTRQIFFEFQF